MFRKAAQLSVACALLGGSLGTPGHAQTQPPVVIRDPKMAQGALKEVNAALRAAIRQGSREELLAAITKFQQVIGALAELDYTGLKKDVEVTRGLYYEALGTLLNTLTTTCEKGSLPDGLSAADLLRAIDPTTASGLGARRMQDIRKRLPECLALTLRIDSGISESNLNYFVQVEVVVPLKYDLDAGYYRGQGQITVLQQRATPPGPCKPVFNNRPADFIVNRLDLKKRDDTHLGEVLLSDYQVGQLDLNTHLVCPAPAPPIPMKEVNWTTLFQMARFEQGNVQVRDWRISYPQNAVASKQYSGLFGKYFTEATDIILVHSGKKR